jgi:hypothetical protein
MKKLSPVALALAMAFPFGAQAQSNADLKKEIDMLKAQIAELKQMVLQKAAAPAVPVAAPVASNVGAELAKLRVKVEAMEDAQEANGFGGLKFSGAIDPTYVYSQRAGRGQFVFLNGTDGIANDLTTDAFSYMNSNIGGVMLKFEKKFDNDMMATIKLKPYKSVNTTWVEESFLTIPIGDSRNVIVGKLNSYNGYEVVDSSEAKNVTHNLLYDFGGPLTMTGAGLNFKAAGMDWKTIAGNMNSDTDLPGTANHNRGIHWRGDMALGEFSGWGISGMHGTLGGEDYNYLDVDYWFTRGDLTINAQVELSKHKNMAFNGGDAGHVGLSGLVAYKLGEGWETVARIDWLDDHKNGGSRGGETDCLGIFDGTQTGVAATSCGNYRSGWGPGAYFDDVDGGWALGDQNRGAKRTALTLGLNYQFHEKALLKLEYRHDRSDLYTFYDFSSGSYKKSNNVIALQTVVKF